MRTDKEMIWTTLGSRNIIDRPWLSARQDQVQMPNGTIYDEYYVLHYPTWVNIIVITEDGKMLLEHQYRHAIGRVSTEIVAGCVEEGETPLEGAKRELEEETGYTGGQWSLLMTIAPNASTMDNYCYCYLVEGAKPTSSPHLDTTEDIEVTLHTKQEVLDMLRRGEFCQALMIAPLWRYFCENP